MRREQRLALAAIVGWCTFLTAVSELIEERRRERDDDLEAADCTDVLQLCPDPTRHEAATAGEAPC